MRYPVWFRWLGVAGIELRARQQVLLIDPFLTRPPLRRLFVGRVEPDRALFRQYVSGADTILVTHAHWDHLLDVAAIAEFTGSIVVGSANTCQIVAAQGVRPAQIKHVDAGDRLALGPFQVEVLPGTHGRTPIDWLINGRLPRDLRPPLRLRDYRMDCCFSFRIEVEGLRLLDCPGPATPADVLVIGTDTAATSLERLLRQVRPRSVIPVHWDNLFRPLGGSLSPMLPALALRLPRFRWMDPHLFAGHVARLAPGTRVLVPMVLERYDLQLPANGSDSVRDRAERLRTGTRSRPAR
jgi:L-ascorbate metabolism protein UlaG (beta-lactamase superfamily)